MGIFLIKFLLSKVVPAGGCIKLLEALCAFAYYFSCIWSMVP